jgi:dTDP-4-dehydrorhamnose reductase
MRILVTGAAGMLGHDLVPVLSRAHQVKGVDLEDLDITDRSAAAGFIQAERPEVVIHAAAYTDVDAAESDPAKATAVNSRGAENVASACREVGARMILISTDYVFDGEKRTPYVESDRPNPVNAYGRSKLEGEILARRALPTVTVVRTAWLYGAGGENFITKILARARGASCLQVVSDEVGSPTWTADLSAALKQLIESGAFGQLYHLAGAGACSRYEFAAELFSLLGIKDCRLEPVGKESFPTPARRPASSALSSERIGLENIEPLRHWREALNEFAALLPSQI